jgi:carbon storage regulator CsrA
MLVLSRRPSEKIVFPNLGITIHFLRMQGQVVKVGIEAPPSVKVLRHELGPPGAADPPTPLAPTSKQQHIELALRLLQKQWKMGDFAEVEATLEETLGILQKLDNDAQPNAITSDNTPAERPKCKALVVDDDANERELLAGLLNMKGCECDTVADGVDALAYLASRRRPDVVLLDMLMPRCDGPSTLAMIREHPSLFDLKVFAISGLTPQETGVKTGPGGVDAWFHKPLNPQKLWLAIQELQHSPTEE